MGLPYRGTGIPPGAAGTLVGPLPTGTGTGTGKGGGAPPRPTSPGPGFAEERWRIYRGTPVDSGNIYRLRLNKGWLPGVRAAPAVPGALIPPAECPPGGTRTRRREREGEVPPLPAGERGKPQNRLGWRVGDVG